jgi:hypothetical protein
MLQVAVRDEDAERREYSLIGANSAVDRHSSDSPQDGWDAPRELSRIPVIPAADEVQGEENATGVPELTLEDAFGPLGGRLGTSGMFGKDGGMLVTAPAPVQPVSALDRLMARNNALFGAGIKASEVSAAAEFVYPDIPLIRLILKTIANLLRATHVSGTYSAEYCGELGCWLRELEIGPPVRDSSASNSTAAPGRIRLLRVVRRDETVAFYFNQIAAHS